MPTYYGGKNHIFRSIINLIPEHDRFVELFAGSAAVARNLARRHAEHLVVELDPEQAKVLRMELPGDRIYNVDGIELLRVTEASTNAWRKKTVIFADPPYPLEDRRAPKSGGYRFEFTDDQHHELAELLLTTEARVLVCGHPWGLYPQLYHGWKRHEFAVTLRSGKPGIECVWTNYEDPFPLHDYSFFGENKRVRQDLHRQTARNVAKFEAMDRHVRVAVLRELVARFGDPGGDRASPRRRRSVEAPATPAR